MSFCSIALLLNAKNTCNLLTYSSLLSFALTVCANIAFVVGVKCPAFHTHFLDRFECENSTVHFWIVLRVDTLMHAKVFCQVGTNCLSANIQETCSVSNTEWLWLLSDKRQEDIFLRHFILDPFTILKPFAVVTVGSLEILPKGISLPRSVSRLLFLRFAMVFSKNTPTTLTIW